MAQNARKAALAAQLVEAGYTIISGAGNGNRHTIAHQAQLQLMVKQ